MDRVGRNQENETMPHSGGNVVASGNYSRAMGADELRNADTIREAVENAREITYPEVDGPSEPMGEEIAMDIAMPTSNSDVRGVSINPLSSGYLVKVGCQSVAVETTEKLIAMLNLYLSDSADFERKWYSKDVRNRLENIL